MTTTMAVAAGGDAAASLRAAWAPDLAGGAALLVEHRGAAVAWATGNRWVEASDDGDVVIVLDGRLHDDAPVGSQADALRHRYRRSGTRLAEGLAGDFVVVVLDRRTGTLLVARDPVGVRPWYLAERAGRAAGASEVATLLALGWVDTAVDEQVAVEYLAARTASRGGTFHRGIRTLAAGATWHRTDTARRTLPHHRWDVRAESGVSWDDAIERCRAELDGAVRRRLAVGGRPTSEISGGLDSSAVVGTVAGLGHPDDLLVARLVFEGPAADERTWSDAVVRHWRVPMISVEPWRPTVPEAEGLTERLGRPLPDPHFVMFASLRRALGERGRHDVLTGLGGDDAFVGVGTGAVVVSAAQLHQWPVLGRIARASVVRPGAAWRSLWRPALHHLAPWKGARPPRWLSTEAVAGAGLDRAGRDRPPATKGAAAVDERMANLTAGYDAAVLEEQAIVSDLVGVRATHPFLDPRFIAATYGLDPTWPTRGGHTRALEVAAYGDRVPSVIADRRTKGEFSEVFWPQVLDRRTVLGVRTGPLAERGWLDIAGFDGLVGDAQRGMANAAIPLSRCVSLSRWLSPSSRR
ncbi:hypothetical protein BH23ACT2_BH23ACT2_24790 [soil metagenome]